MAGFKFRLAPVHDLRRHLEKESKDALSREKHTLALLEQEADRLSAAGTLWSGRYMRCAASGTSPSEVLRIITYIDEINRLIEKNGNDIAAQGEVVEKARRLLVEKMKDRKTLDLLCDRQKQSFVEAEQKKEETTLEEQILGRMYTA